MKTLIKIMTVVVGVSACSAIENPEYPTGTFACLKIDGNKGMVMWHYAGKNDNYYMLRIGSPTLESTGTFLFPGDPEINFYSEIEFKEFELEHCPIQEQQD
jgi:hypothetical protein